ncbi:fatty acid-binding protein, muscle-like isoform X2 [Bacillus rossius redtenbacheri]|uniref:fatty acid-binding protein, muscle-like isoform X2 n=1 Tax=Bacillus rossius redtenbacheri TaxID=93214 RepID=UPI002FDD6F68
MYRPALAACHSSPGRGVCISPPQSASVSRSSTPNMDAFLNKKYKLSSSDNFDEYMKALNVGLVTRKMGNTVSPTIELKKAGDEYSLQTTSTLKSTTITFKLGQEFDEETADGRKVKSTVTFDGNKMVHNQKGEKDTVIIREFSADEVKATMTADNVVCTRVYKLVE